MMLAMNTLLSAKEEAAAWFAEAEAGGQVASCHDASIPRCNKMTSVMLDFCAYCMPGS